MWNIKDQGDITLKAMWYIKDQCDIILKALWYIKDQGDITLKAKWYKGSRWYYFESYVIYKGSRWYHFESYVIYKGSRCLHFESYVIYKETRYITLKARRCHLQSRWYQIETYVLLYNYRLLMRSTRYNVDRVWYWLTDAVGGGKPIPDKVYMVPSRPKSKVYNCFIKLSGILQENDFTWKRNAHDVVRRKQIRREMRCVYCDVIRKRTPNSPVWAKICRVSLCFRCDITETPNRPSLSICGVLTLRYGRGKHVSANQE